MSRKRLVILHPALFSQAMGGAELQIDLIIRVLVPKFDISYIFEDKGTGATAIKNVILFPMNGPKFRKVFGPRWILYAPLITWKLIILRPDTIYTRGAYSWSCIAAVYCLLTRATHIWSIANDSDVDISITPSDFLRPLALIEKLCIKFAFLITPRFLVQNEYQEVALADKNTTKLPQLAEEEHDRIEKSDVFTILWIANLKPTKRPEQFLRLVELFDDQADIRFYMIGRGHKAYQSDVENVMKRFSNFHFFGEIAQEDVYAHMRASHVLVNTSLNEGFSNTYVQAWMRGVPVISMRSDPDGLISAGQLGFMAEGPENAANIIRRLQSDPKLLTSMRSYAQDYSSRNHSLSEKREYVSNLFCDWRG